MKYISVLIFLLLLTWTWQMATAESPLNLQQHRKVEAGVEDDIRGFIQRRFPQTREILCPQLYTEEVDPGKELIAHFRCQATGDSGAEETTEQIFEGQIRLRSTDNFASWSEVGGEIRAPEIRFLKGVEIKPDGKN